MHRDIASQDQPAPSVTPEHIDNIIKTEQYHVFPDTCLTVCALTLANGFNVVGESACAHSGNFDAEIGRAIAREDAVSKVWMLEGYLLRQRIHDGEATTPGA